MKYKIETFDNQSPVSNEPLPINQPSIMTFVGSRGSGKSSVILSLIKNTYNGVFHRIIFFNPTFYRDEKYEKLLNISHILKQKPKEKKDILSRPKNHPYLLEAKEPPFTGKINPSDVYTSNIEDNLTRIVNEKIELNNKNEKWLIVLDDISASGITRHPHFLEVLLNGRHLNITLWLSVQFYVSLAPPTRNQVMVWFLFNFPNINEVNRFYQENSCRLSEEDWMKIYHYAVDRPYGFLTINHHNTHDKHKIFTDSLQNFISIKDKENGQ